MDRELALEVVRVTEGAALEVATWLGRGNKMEADNAATTAMRTIFDSINMRGKVIIGEGEIDEAPMLYIGEELGTGHGLEVDIAVDPLEGTNIVAKGYSNAINMFILQLALIIIAAKLAGSLSVKFGQPSVLGEIIVGVLIGPSVLGLIGATDTLSTFSTIGVILLMFIAGLETDLDEFKRSGKSSIL